MVGLHEVSGASYNNRNGARQSLGSTGAQYAGRYNDVDVHSEQFSRKGRKPLLISLCPPVLKGDVFPLYVSKLLQALAKSLNTIPSADDVSRIQIPYPSDPPRLLRFN
jgi:hypothetical protein